MNAKEYLSQALTLDREINSLLEQLAWLRATSTKATSIITDTPPSPTVKCDKMEGVVIKIIELENRIDDEIDRLVDLQREMSYAISEMDDAECRQVLRLRYLAFKKWKDVAKIMHMEVRHVYRVHDAAIEKFEKKFERGKQKHWKSPCPL